jgi:nitroimidazol reductase NimA-like FMN-containing flavoprotein (pyridoxamine 5'-phosphate oxidase superfamily)
MKEPHFTRPHFPEGYLAAPKGFVAWSHVESRLSEARNYWLCTVQPNGHPHAVPKWGVWLDGKLYFDGSPETRHSRNIARNPSVAVHLESGDDVVVVDGTARAHPKPSPELGLQLANAYSAKYADFGYSPKPDQWDNGGLYEVTPTTVLAWTKFTEDPTKFTFEA